MLRLFSAVFAVMGFCFSTVGIAADFHGLESTTLPAVQDAPGQWGLKITVFNVGQADSILLVTPDGDTCLIDTGKASRHGDIVADFLCSKAKNGIGPIGTVGLLFTTHYDLDHIGGLPRLVARGIHIRQAFDQGPSLCRQGNRAYCQYLTALGDIDDNCNQFGDEPCCVRQRAVYDQTQCLGAKKQVEIRCVAVRGDTRGTAFDKDLDPATKKGRFNENPGCVALLIRLGEFEFYTAGDQTDNDWKKEFPAEEEAVLDSGAIPGGSDIDMLKVSHHGSDTGTSHALVQEMAPEVAIISSTFTKTDRLPKKVVLKQLQENRCYVLITGDGKNPLTHEYADAPKTAEDDGFVPSEQIVFNKQGNVTVLVSTDGNRYTVIGNSFKKTFSAKDGDNLHPSSPSKRVSRSRMSDSQ